MERSGVQEGRTPVRTFDCSTPRNTRSNHLLLRESQVVAALLKVGGQQDLEEIQLKGASGAMRVDSFMGEIGERCSPNDLI